MAQVSPHLNPVTVTRDVTNSTGSDAVAFRYGFGALAQPLGGFAWAQGVFPGQSSGTTILDYRVTQASPSANMTVLVQPGQSMAFRSPASSRGPYIGTSTGSFSVTIGAANAANPRIDIIVMRYRDVGFDSSPPQTYAPVVIAGTPAASPSAPTGSLTDGDVVLAWVTVRANTSSILDTDITDQRLFDAARGGIYPKASGDTRNGAYPGHFRWNIATSSLEVWTGAAWLVCANPAIWSTFTPTLTYQGASAGGSGPSGAVAVSSAVGRYLAIGKTLHLRYQFLGSVTPSGGSGDIYTALPAGFTSAASGESHIPAKLNTTNNDVWLGDCFIPANGTGMRIYMPNSQSDCRIKFPWRVATSTGAAGTGIPLIAGGYPDLSLLVVQGTIEVQ